MLDLKKIFKNEEERVVVRGVDYIDLLITPSNIVEEKNLYSRVFLQGAFLIIPVLKKHEQFILKLGTIVQTSPSEILDDSVYGGSGDYKVLRYQEGDAFIRNRRVIKHISNVDYLFNKSLLAGKVKGLPYRDIKDVFESNIALNTDLNVSSALKEMLIEELFRDQDDISRPVRLREDEDYNKYKTLNARAINQTTSTHGAMTFEDAGTSTIISTSRKDKGNEPILAKYFNM